MSGHDYHPDLPGFHPGQLYHDGCAECEMRAGDMEMSVTCIRDWNAAVARSTAHAMGCLDNVSHAEVPLLRMLWALQQRMSGANIR